MTRVCGTWAKILSTKSSFNTNDKLIDWVHLAVLMIKSGINSTALP